jgi:hypothetical protein
MGVIQSSKQQLRSSKQQHFTQIQMHKIEKQASPAKLHFIK